MSAELDMLDFVKAMSDADRLRIIGVLAHGPAGAAQVSAELGLPPSEVFNHLAHLEHVGAVRKSGERYELDSAGLVSLSKRQFGGGRAAYTPAPDLDRRARRVLSAHLNVDGTVRSLPSQPARLRVILKYLAAAFTPGVNYTEKEVNTILRRFHVDVSGLRRDLIDAGLLARESDGSRYWRVTGAAAAADVEAAR
jgi:hypothetical protein